MALILHRKGLLCPLLVALFMAMCNGSFASLQNFETTRLKSTAGAGVGSILMNEGSILNPAPLAFFNMSSFYYQKTGINENSPGNRGSGKPESEQTAIIASDASRRTGGSIAYIKSNQGYSSRKRISVAMGYPTGKQSAFGMTYRRTVDRLSENGSDYSENKYNQVVIGVMHALSAESTFGMVAVDPIKRDKADSKVMLGFQYVYKSFASFIFDVGSRYTSKFSEQIIYKGALQVKTFKDLFLRAGVFRDRSTMEKGTGVGVGWVQPRLVIDAGLRNTYSLLSTKESEHIKESSFSVAYRF